MLPRNVLPRDAIIVAGSGNTQGAVKQTFPVHSPRTRLTSGGFSSLGWAIPAAVGAKLARPDSPDFAAMGRSFGIESWKVNDAASLEPTLRTAVQSGAPALIEVPTDRDAAGPWVPGWWDFPIPAYIKDERQDEYDRIRARSSTSETAPRHRTDHCPCGRAPAARAVRVPGLTPRAHPLPRATWSPGPLR
ncbi:thiamine pyrophosphate-dependent enzyme [Streptomyces scabiei]|uniref:thiamine pyrophosphate-dependent enzyme n=1 Tax=Streptomyces scabiei TaxID=1930 RepID=UPI00299060EF|nr:thiamine pyrophosphate-dependent enzyme [Streptomyces scabiei]MDW8807272.1 thiamine pyrophosphate-dependent enzyme [Streptomyces scabiei]